jgi:DNA-binding MarR family transcriptional regulator
LNPHRASAAPQDDDILALAECIRQAVGEFVRAARAQANTPSTARAETLGLLDRQGAMSTAALAERRHVKHQSMRLVVAQLEQDGLIDRTADPLDRRSQLATLNAKGRAELQHGRQIRAEWIAKALRDKATVEDRQVLKAAAAILTRLAATPPREG